MFKILFPLIFLLSICTAGIDEIPTTNTGEHGMIDAFINKAKKDKVLSTKQITVGAGISGAKAFKKKSEGMQVLFTWQWLDEMKELHEDTIIVVPRHAVNENFKQLQCRRIEIEGVLHTTTIESIHQEDLSLLPIEPEIIVMLGGDTQQENGEWKTFTKEHLSILLSALDPQKKILFLNGPRTGKFIANKEGKLEEDKAAHRLSTDHISAELILQTVKNCWAFSDFKFGTPSLWKPALKYCLENTNVVLVLPGESTSMISESLSLGIKPSVYSHSAMTKVSMQYLKNLQKDDLITIFPDVSEIQKQEPIPDQIHQIIESLKVL